MNSTTIVVSTVAILAASSGIVFLSYGADMVSPLPDPGEDDTIVTMDYVFWFNETVSLDMRVGDVERYERDTHHDMLMFQSGRYITEDDPIVLELHSKLMQKCIGFSDDDTIAYLYRFVKDAISYTDDWRVWGEDDYTQYPAQTLYLGTGDCEDMAILLYTLYALSGYDAVLVWMDDHISVGVECGIEGDTARYLLNGIDYLYTDPCWNHIGQRPLLSEKLVFKPSLTMVAWLTLISGGMFIGAIYLVVLQRSPSEEGER